MKKRTCPKCEKEIPSSDYEFCPFCSNPIEDTDYLDYFNQGIDCHEKGKHEEALEYYTKALSKNPKDSDILCNRGNVYLDMGKYDKAIEDYGRAIKLNPNDSDLYTNRADVYRKLGENEKALKDYKKALEIKTNEISSKSNEDEVKEDKNKIGKIQYTIKDPVIAAILSFFVPGLGHIYGGEIEKGLGLIFLWGCAVLLSSGLIGSIMFAALLSIVTRPIVFILMIMGAFDAYKTVKKNNQEHDK